MLTGADRVRCRAGISSDAGSARFTQLARINCAGASTPGIRLN